MATLDGMAEIPTSRHAPVTIEAVRATLTGVPFGYYTAADLLPRYDTWAEAEGIPAYARATAQELGIALRELGFGAHRRRGHPALWTVDPARIEAVLMHPDNAPEGTVSETPSGPLR